MWRYSFIRSKKQYHQVGMSMEKEYWSIQERSCEIAEKMGEPLHKEVKLQMSGTVIVSIVIFVCEI